MVVRIARGDVNMPGFDGFAIERQVPEVHFEAACYNLLSDEADIRVSRLLYYRAPIQHPAPRDTIPTDILGRRLFIFERADGVNDVWDELEAENKVRSNYSQSSFVLTVQ
jgi:hypothetical protein